MRKSKADLVRGWLEKARRNLLVATRALENPEPLTDIICFHAQQAVEKYLKAYLVWHEVGFPRTHALEDLALLAAQVDQEFQELVDEVVVLTPYAVEVRYPEFEIPSLEDAEEALRTAHKVARIVLGKLRDVGKND